MRILFIQAEYPNLEPSFPWAFSIRGDLIESMSLFAKVDVLYSTEIQLNLNSWLLNYKYDAVFINDINHINFDDLEGYNILSISQLLLIKEKKIKIIANSIETIFHTNKDYINIFNARLSKFIKLHNFFDGFITYDYYDSLILTQMKINNFYRPFSLIKDNFLDLTNSPNSNFNLLFLGSIYAARVDFINQSIYKDQITFGTLDHSDSEISNSIFLKNILSLTIDTIEYQNLSTKLELLKKQYALLFLKTLSETKLIINLPSMFQGIPCRAVESIFSKSIFLVNYPRTSVETYFLKNITNCFFYDAKSVENFDSTITFLKDNLNSLPSYNLETDFFDSTNIMKKIIYFIENS